MKVEQVYNIVNEMTSEITGQSDLVAKDLSNIVDVGKAIFDVTDVDNYVNKLINVIGRTIFVDRKYEGELPSVMMDSWEFGSIMRKIKAEMPEATVNPAWKLEDGVEYPYMSFHQPNASEKLFNQRVTFEVKMSYTEDQVKESFHGQGEVSAFLGMLFNEVEKSITIKMDGLLKATIANFIADTVYDAYGGNPTAGQTSTRAINLLHLYHEQMQAGVPPENQLSASDALRNPEFIRFAVMQMKNHVAQLRTANRMYNVGGNVRFTSAEYLHNVLLASFKNAAAVYLQADTYNKEFTELPEAESVSYWQGPGQSFSFEDTSRITIEQTANGNANVEVSGIIGVMFDRNALGVVNEKRKVTSTYNPEGDFFTNFYKQFMGYFNDFDEQFIVFYIQ